MDAVCAIANGVRQKTTKSKIEAGERLFIAHLPERVLTMRIPQPKNGCTGKDLERMMTSSIRGVNLLKRGPSGPS
jgi:hypothetical protein